MSATPRLASLQHWPEPPMRPQSRPWLACFKSGRCHSALATSIRLSTVLMVAALLLPWWVWTNETSDGGEGAQWVGGGLWLHESRFCIQRLAGRSDGSPGGFCMAIIAPQLPLRVDYLRVAGCVAGVCLLLAIACVLWSDSLPLPGMEPPASLADEVHDCETEEGVKAARTCCSTRTLGCIFLFLASSLCTVSCATYYFHVGYHMVSDPDGMLGITNSEPVMQGWGPGLWVVVAASALSWVHTLTWGCIAVLQSKEEELGDTDYLTL